MGRRRKKLPAEPIEVTIEDLTHDGRGVATVKEKKLFVAGALTGETVMAKYTARNRRFDEAETVEVLKASEDRIEPRCPHFGHCGGCALQHMDPTKQIESKQNTLIQNLKRIGGVEPEDVYAPLTGPLWHYRRKARLSVRYVHRKERVLVGFREPNGRFVADIGECHVLNQEVAEQLPALSRLVHSLEAYRSIPQIEVACGDTTSALVFRHLEPLSDDDLGKLKAYAQETGIAVFLQSKGPNTITALYPEQVQLSFAFPEHDLELEFIPANFIQVNGEMNRSMVKRTLELLQPDKEDRILDLFCGLGNFSLPIARYAGAVVGVEGDQQLVNQAGDNAARNQMDHARFYAADLTEEPGQAQWLRQSYNKVLLDPPRSGAEFILPHVAKTGADRVVYVSCHPASLARDAGILVKEYGYKLKGAGVMDMFPHTGHVESIALFER